VTRIRDRQIFVHCTIHDVFRFDCILVVLIVNYFPLLFLPPEGVVARSGVSAAGAPESTFERL